MNEKSETIGVIWEKVGRIKNPYPNWLGGFENQQRRKGFSAAKRAIRKMLWELLKAEHRKINERQINKA